jgi:hypothetical protein
MRWLVGLLALGLLTLGLYTWTTLNWAYATGERAGYVQKLSKKGWICKTWEGELAMVNLPGAMPEKFSFTVRKDAVAESILKTMGKRVALVYQQHKGVPTRCFGDTEYYVVDVRLIE